MLDGIKVLDFSGIVGPYCATCRTGAEVIRGKARRRRGRFAGPVGPN